MSNLANKIQIYVQNNKFTNFIFTRISDLNDNKMVYVTLKWGFVKKNHLYKMINVIIIMQNYILRITPVKQNSVILENRIILENGKFRSLNIRQFFFIH